MAARCTFVTYAGLPRLDPDDLLAARALERLGVEVRAAVWDDPSVDWELAGTCVLRSTWDYPQRPQAFVAWLGLVEARTVLWNPPAVVRWNLHKFYLRDLAASGVPVVPTAWLPAGTAPGLAELVGARGWPEAVVKPAYGAGTVGVHLFALTPDGLAAAERHANLLLARGDVLVQRYLPSVEDYRERALVFIGGAYSHAVSKAPFQALLPAGEAGELPAEATPAELAVARLALAAAPGPHLYARVDLVRDEAGAPLLLELELVEPSLFLGMSPQAPGRLAGVLAAAIGKAGPVPRMGGVVQRPI